MLTQVSSASWGRDYTVTAATSVNIKVVVFDHKSEKAEGEL